MPLTLKVSTRGYTDLRALKEELAQVPSQEPEAVVVWAKEHPDSAWANHLDQNTGTLVVEYVRSLIRIVVLIDVEQPAPKRIAVAVKPAAPIGAPGESRLHRDVKPVRESEVRARLSEFFKGFAPLRLCYADVAELQPLFAEAERLRKDFNIFS